MSDPHILSVVAGPADMGYIITMSTGDVIVTNYTQSTGNTNYLWRQEAADGTSDGQIDTADLITEILAGNTTDGYKVFRSSTDQEFTVTAGVGTNSYVIELADGTSVTIDSATLVNLDNEGSTNSDGIVDVDGLVDNDEADGILGWYSSSNTDFTVEMISNSGYLITTADGHIYQVNGSNAQIELADLVTGDGQIDVDALATSTRAYVNEYVSSSGQGFTVDASYGGSDARQLIIHLDDGTVIVARGSTSVGSNLDAEDGTNDGKIDVDNLIDSDSNDRVVSFYSGGGDGFTISAGTPNAFGGVSSKDYVITFDDGRVLVVNDVDLTGLDDEDATANDGAVNVDDLFNTDSSDNIAEFYSSSNQDFSVTVSSGDNSAYGAFLIAREDGSVVVTYNVTTSALDSEDGASDGRVDIDNLVDSDNSDSILEFYSATGETFTVEPGINQYDFVITKSDGEVIIINGVGQLDVQTFATLDEENGDALDGRINIDTLGDLDGTDGVVVVSGGPVPCFTPGTVITTINGPVAIEDLSVGDKVLTRGSGFQPIRWKGTRKLSDAALKTNPKLYPVAITAGAFGNGMPKSDMLISRQHRMLISSPAVERLFGEKEALVSGIKLTSLPGIYVDEGVSEVEYIHLLFDQHEIIYADGTPSESLYLGTEALNALSEEALQEIYTLFPELSKMENTFDFATFVPTNKSQKQLVASMVNDAP